MNNRWRGICFASAALFVLGAGGSRALAQAAQETPENKRISLNLENADIRYALRLLFTSAGVNFNIDNAVQGSTTVSLTDVPFKTALESVLRSTSTTNPLTYRKEDNIYYVSPKVEPTVEIKPEETPDANKEPPSRIRRI